MAELSGTPSGSAVQLSEVLAGPGPQVARRLLGSVLRNGSVAVRITEVEAYAGAADPASHAYRGETARNAVMFGPPGRLYVYFSYGMHHAVNLVCGPTGEPTAVLLRAGEVIAGRDLARERRGPVVDVRLACGPGNLAKALGLTLADNGVAPLPDPQARIGWEPAPRPIRMVSTGPRVGISAAADRRWRWWLTGNPTVSVYRRSPRAAQPGNTSG